MLLSPMCHNRLGTRFLPSFPSFLVGSSQPPPIHDPSFARFSLYLANPPVLTVCHNRLETRAFITFTLFLVGSSLNKTNNTGENMNTNSNTQVFVDQLREQIKSAPSGIDISALENALKDIEQPVQTGAKIWFLLDRSGSMGRLTNDVINGFNKSSPENIPPQSVHCDSC